MKKTIRLIIALGALLCLCSCNKDGSSPLSPYTTNNNLPGTSWVDDAGDVLSFSKTEVTLNGSSATYKVSLEVDQTTQFSVDDLTSGGKTYVSGVASLQNKVLYLKEYGNKGQLHFELKR